MYNWDDLRVFIEVSKTLNLSKAARHLDVDQSTVYRRLLRLEKELGKKLLKNTNQGYVLTYVGEELVRNSAKLSLEMEHVNLFLDNLPSETHEFVNIRTTSDIANAVLPPILSKFNAQFPHIQINITICDGHFDPFEREATFVIRSSEDVELYEVANKVGRSAWSLYATKDYLKDKPKMDSPNFFSDNSFILGSKMIAHLKSTIWLKTKVPEENISFTASSIESLYFGVKAGLGIALLPCVYKNIDNSLVEISEPDPTFSFPLWLITHKQRLKTEKISTCLDYFQQELKKVFLY